MESIRVAVRIRPNDDNITNRTGDNLVIDSSCIRVHESNTIQIAKVKDNGLQDSHQFSFDKVFDTKTTQDEVFQSVRDLIGESMKGFNVSVFAFGQTGSGKTFTISGTQQHPGIVPRTVHHIFSNLRQRAEQSKETVSMVFLTYVELYNNTLYDLLSSDTPQILGFNNSSNENTGGGGLKIHDHPTLGIQLSGSSTIRTPVSSAEDALQLITKGNRLRATASTNLNDRSSRSHTVISFEVVSKNLQSDDTDKFRMGKINLIDLAGSENVKLSGAEGQTLEEAKQINKALTVLGDVLNSLSKFYMDQKSSSVAAVEAKPPHIPFRNSKLTMLLKDSLGGNAKTMMIATVRLSTAYYQQSLTALRYAARTRHIRCSPTLNVGHGGEDGGSNNMHKALGEVARLKSQLENRTAEFNTLIARLHELEKNRVDGKEGTVDDASIRTLEEGYRRQIEQLKEQSQLERQQLNAHLSCMILNQESKLAAKEQGMSIHSYYLDS